MPTQPPRPRRPSADGPVRVRDLGMAEQLVVSSLRLWTEPLRRPEDPPPRWQDGLTAAGLPNDAAVALDTALRITIAAATRPLDIHRPHCPMLGQDEARLLDMIGLLQVGRHGEAGVLLADWLALVGVRMALAPLCVLAGAMEKAGLRLPVALEAETPAPPPARHARTGAAQEVSTPRPTTQVDRGATLVH